SDVAFAGVAVTPNQRAVARALDAIGASAGNDFDEVLKALFPLTPEEARAAFEALSGMQPTHGLYIARQALRGLSRISFGRLGGGGRNSDLGLSGLTLAFADEPLAASLAEEYLMRLDGPGGAHDRGLWARGYGVFGDIDGDG